MDELGGPDHRFFQVSLELTRKGIEQIDTTILHCFEALKEIETSSLPAYLFEERNTMAKLNYEYQEREEPFNYIENLGGTIATEDLNTYPRDLLLASHYDVEKVQRLASLLNPNECLISLLASPDVTKVAPEKKERWQGAEYTIRPIPEKWLDFWENAKPNPQIRIADPNPFIPSNLALAETGPSTPEMIANHDLGLAYYVRSPEFSVPDSNYYIHILSSEIDQSAKSSVLTALYLDHLTDLLQPTIAAAKAAGTLLLF